MIMMTRTTLQTAQTIQIAMSSSLLWKINSIWILVINLKIPLPVLEELDLCLNKIGVKYLIHELNVIYDLLLTEISPACSVDLDHFSSAGISFRLVLVGECTNPKRQNALPVFETIKKYIFLNNQIINLLLNDLCIFCVLMSLQYRFKTLNSLPITFWSKLHLLKCNLHFI